MVERGKLSSPLPLNDTRRWWKVTALSHPCSGQSHVMNDSPGSQLEPHGPVEAGWSSLQSFLKLGSSRNFCSIDRISSSFSSESKFASCSRHSYTSLSSKSCMRNRGPAAALSASRRACFAAWRLELLCRDSTAPKYAR